jgi:hypothetical protein
MSQSPPPSLAIMNEYGMPVDGLGVLWLTVRELRPQIQAYTTNGESSAVAELVKVL